MATLMPRAPKFQVTRITRQSHPLACLPVHHKDLSLGIGKREHTPVKHTSSGQGEMLRKGQRLQLLATVDFRSRLMPQAILKEGINNNLWPCNRVKLPCMVIKMELAWEDINRLPPPIQSPVKCRL